MIRVTVELLPLGLEDHPRRKVLGTATLSNIGGTETSGDYRWKFLGAGGQTLWTGELRKFPRLRLLAWDLLFRALRESPVGYRNGAGEPNPGCCFAGVGQACPVHERR